MSTEVLSVRVRKELKKEAEELGINLREVIERTLMEEIEKARKAKLRELMRRAISSMDLTSEEWTRTVKEVRREE